MNRSTTRRMTTSAALLIGAAMAVLAAPAHTEGMHEAWRMWLGDKCPGTDGRYEQNLCEGAEPGSWPITLEVVRIDDQVQVAARDGTGRLIALREGTQSEHAPDMDEAVALDIRFVHKRDRTHLAGEPGAWTEIEGTTEKLAVAAEALGWGRNLPGAGATGDTQMRVCPIDSNASTAEEAPTPVWAMALTAPCMWSTALGDPPHAGVYRTANGAVRVEYAQWATHNKGNTAPQGS